MFSLAFNHHWCRDVPWGINSALSGYVYTGEKGTCESPKSKIKMICPLVMRSFQSARREIPGNCLGLKSVGHAHVRVSRQEHSESERGAGAGSWPALWALVKKKKKSSVLFQM